MSDRTAIRDLLLPGVVGVENALGVEHCSDLVVDDEGLHLTIEREGRQKQYALATADEVQSGAYKDTFAPRLRDAFADFLREDGVTGVREFLEKRGPRGTVAAEATAGPAPPGDAA